MKTLRGRWGLVGILAITGLFLGAVTQAGAETLKWRQTYHATKGEAIEVGDVPGHTVGLGEAAGLAFFETGEVATLSYKGTGDYTKGSGPHQGYFLYTFEDGSTFVLKIQGTATADPGGKISWIKGTFSFIQGTGRFAGIQGSGSYTGKRFTPWAVGAEVYVDVTATYTLPSR